MGKYIKRKGLGKIAMRELPQTSLGVWTRARALALQKHPRFCHTSRVCESLKRHCQSECEDSFDIYMELRSRRLEKVSRCSSGRRDDAARAARKREKSAVERSRPFKASDSDRSPNEASRLRLPNTSSSSHAFSHPVSAAASDTSHTSPAQASLQCSVRSSTRSGLIKRRFTPIAPARSKNVSGSQSQSGFLGVIRSNQRPEFASPAGQEGMADTNAACRMQAGRSCGNQNLEVEPFFGENSIVAGPHSRDSQLLCEPEKRPHTRDITPDSCIRNDQGPGSTSRTHRPGRRQGRSVSAPPFARTSEAPCLRDIEAFLECAEQQEQTRFMERYNFDPVNDRPLRGRYEWFRK